MSKFQEMSEELNAAAERMLDADTEEEFNRLFEEYKRLEAEWYRAWRERTREWEADVE